MTDELSIQPQVIQERRKDNSALYGVGGAVVGAGAGYGVNRAFTKPMSHDDIVAEVNDKDKFEVRTKEGAPEAATWKDVKAKADEVTTKKAELEKASKGTLEEGAIEKTEFNAAEKAKNDAYARLFDKKKAELEGTTTGSSKIDPKKFKEFKDIKTKYLSDVNVRTGATLTSEEQSELYKKLTDAVINAQNKLETDLDTGLRADKKKVMAEIEDNFKAAYTDLKGKKPDQISAYFAEKETGGWHILKKPKSPQYDRVFKIAEAKYPIPTDLTDEQFLSIGKELAPGETAPSGWLSKPVKCTPDKVGGARKTVYYDPNEAAKLLKSEVEKAKNMQTTVADQIFAETQKAVAIKADIEALPEKVANNVTVVDAKATGLYTPASGTTPDKLDISKIITESKNKSNIYKSKEGYLADIELLESKLKAGTKPTSVTGITLNADIPSTTTVDDALKIIRARHKIAKSYNKQLNVLESNLKDCVKANQIVEEFDAKILEKLNNDKDLNKAREALAKQFPKLFGGEAATTLTADEIKAQAEQFAKENKEYKDLLKVFEEKKAALDKAISERGKVDEGAKKAAQEALDKAEKAFKEKAEALGKKFTKGGINPWVAGAIGAAALGLAAFGISKSANNEA